MSDLKKKRHVIQTCAKKTVGCGLWRWSEELDSSPWVLGQRAVQHQKAHSCSQLSSVAGPGFSKAGAENP